MPPPVQVKLLRVLETRAIDPLGTNESRPVDLRVVAAAKIDLGDPAMRGSFREDLYYRLNVVTLRIPPLRDRRDDIPLLFSHFLANAITRFNRPAPALSQAVRDHLQSHAWPGNVRELAHFAERVALGVDTGGPAAGTADDKTQDPAHRQTLPRQVEAFEAALIRRTLEECGGDVRSTIERLGVPRKTFYDKLQRHGISRRDYDSE